jgi:alpha-beta hydrolase superfamily lysophospholipase
LLIIYILIAFILLVATVIAISGWFASERFLRVSETWYTVTLRIMGVTEDTVTLPRRVGTAYEGVYGITWQDNDAVLGEIVASDGRTVTRRIIKATHPPSVGLLVTWNYFAYQGDPERALGLAYDDVQIPSELGPLPAWFVPGQRMSWILLVHGFHASGEEGLRVLPTLVQMGYPVLVMSYRNDAGAPLSPDHFYHLGDTEWQDVEAGVGYALTHGAQDVVLFGWSMGGSIVEAFLRRSSLAARVRAVVLDSPVLDWPKSLDAQVHNLHFPHWFAHVLKWFAARRAGINFSAINHVHVARTLTPPTLLFHSTADRMVPVVSSDAFARAYPDSVTYQRVHGADHTLLWNVDARAYEDALKAFLTRVSELESYTTV